MQSSRQSIITRILSSFCDECNANSDTSEFSVLAQEGTGSPSDSEASILCKLLHLKDIPLFIKNRLFVKSITMEVAECFQGDSCWFDYVLGSDICRAKGSIHGKKWFLAKSDSAEVIALFSYLATEEDELGALQLSESSGLVTLLINYSDTFEILQPPLRSALRYSIPSEPEEVIIISKDSRTVLKKSIIDETSDSDIDLDKSWIRLLEYFKKLREGSLDPESYIPISSRRSYLVSRLACITVSYEVGDQRLEVDFPLDDLSLGQIPEELGLSMILRNIPPKPPRMHGAYLLLQYVLGIPFEYGLYEGIISPEGLLELHEYGNADIDEAFCKYPKWIKSRIDEFIYFLAEISRLIEAEPRIGNQSSLEVLISDTAGSPLFVPINCWGQELNDAETVLDDEIQSKSMFANPFGTRWVQMDALIRMLSNERRAQRRFLQTLLIQHAESEELVVPIRGLAAAPIVLNYTGCVLCGMNIPKLILSQCIETGTSGFIAYSQGYSYGELDTGFYSTSALEPGSIDRYACKIIPSNHLAWHLSSSYVSVDQ